MISFAKKIAEANIDLNRKSLETLQINLGKLCNQACHHCHVEAGPNRTELMSQTIIEKVIQLLDATPSIKTIDITGGAPEMNPHFKNLVKELKKRNLNVIDRCNLTIFFEEGYEDIPKFLKDNKVHVVASLPCYTKENVDKQRGRGVFDKSIEGLKKLNDLGYGTQGTDLVLDLVYNPGGAYLPGNQKKLEEDYKRELKQFFNIRFNNLYTITNMPIKRFLSDLERSKKLDNYMQLLEDNFNTQAASAVMCKSLVSIGYDGQIYDCDFNQMLEMPIAATIKHINDLKSFNELLNKKIVLGDHCYGCTAGAGSSCSGAIS
jgi:radical SAM/Cys-rich protein